MSAKHLGRTDATRHVQRGVLAKVGRFDISNCRQIVSRYKKLAVTGRYTLDSAKIVWPTLTFAEICISNRY